LFSFSFTFRRDESNDSFVLTGMKVNHVETADGVAEKINVIHTKLQLMLRQIFHRKIDVEAGQSTVYYPVRHNMPILV
jgi:hypothetical protein